METPNKMGKHIIKAKKERKPQTEYIKFFKFYYDKLSKEHPKWAANQISTIIKLLWRKKSKKSTSKDLKMSMRKLKMLKPMSGYEAFKREHMMDDMQASDIKERWNHMPKETKKYWEKKGQMIPMINKNAQKQVIKIGSPMKMNNMEMEMPQSTLKFMSKVM